MIEMEDLPELVSPVVIAAFEGWNDAGEASTAAVAHLAQVWSAEPVAALDPEDYHDFQVNRPRVGTVDGERRITWPTTRLLLARNVVDGRDVILVQGVEPSMRWRSFVVELLTFVDALDASLLVCLGSLLADAPHTRPFPVGVHSEDPHLRHRFDLQASTYEGPTGIVGVLADAAAQAELPTLSCWVSVPHYAGGPPSPKATLAVLARVEELLDVPIDRGDLEDMAKAWERGVEELASADAEVAEYVRTLEQATDAAEHPAASGEAIAAEFERYLRRRDEDQGPGAPGSSRG